MDRRSSRHRDECCPQCCPRMAVVAPAVRSIDVRAIRRHDQRHDHRPRYHRRLAAFRRLARASESAIPARAAAVCGRACDGSRCVSPGCGPGTAPAADTGCLCSRCLEAAPGRSAEFNQKGANCPLGIGRGFRLQRPEDSTMPRPCASPVVGARRRS